MAPICSVSAAVDSDRKTHRKSRSIGEAATYYGTIVIQTSALAQLPSLSQMLYDEAVERGTGGRVVVVDVVVVDPILVGLWSAQR